jgi:SAM-dependent methyltransferase
MRAHNAADLKTMYEARFTENLAYRRKVWRVLVFHFFQKYVAPKDTVLDLGCGYGEFINAVRCSKKLAMDLNPDAPRYLDPSVQFLEQDCSSRWQLESDSVNVVFTSNFFEHLPDKTALGRTFDEIFRSLTPGGKLIAMGPNLKYLPGKYWDFWDHHLPLTEASLSEGLTNRRFQVVTLVDKFLPYTMVKGREYPELFLNLYLKLPIAWQIFGKQFLVVAVKPSARPANK